MLKLRRNVSRTPGVCSRISRLQESRKVHFTDALQTRKCRCYRGSCLSRWKLARASVRLDRSRSDPEHGRVPGDTQHPPSSGPNPSSPRSRVAMPVMARTRSSNVSLLSADITWDKEASQVEVPNMEEMDDLKFAIELSLAEVRSRAGGA